MENDILNDNISSNDGVLSMYDFICLFIAIKRIYGSSLFSPYILNEFIKKCKEEHRFDNFLDSFNGDYNSLINVVKKLMFDSYVDYANLSFGDEDFILFESTRKFQTQKILNKYRKYHVIMTVFVSSFISYQNEMFIIKNENKKRVKTKE